MTTENQSKYATEDFDGIRETLDNSSGPEYWRSLEEMSQTDAFQSYVNNEFSELAAEPLSPMSRRNFLQVMGASLALAGVTSGCARQPVETILPYVMPPEEVIPGKPLYFASAVLNGGYAQGVLVESHMGRPTKIEGLPNFPGTAGRSDAQMQASILDLYDPDRTRVVERNGQVDSWTGFVNESRGLIANAKINQGAGLRLLTGAITSPSEYDKIQAFIAANPQAKWHQYEATGRDNERAGAVSAFGKPVDAVYHFDKADVVVALDGDFLEKGPGKVQYAWDYAQRRAQEHFDEAHEDDHGHDAGHEEAADAEHEGDENTEQAAPEFHATLNRTYSFESSPTLIGAMADHRFPFLPSQIEGIARAIAEKVGVRGASSAEDSGLTEAQLAWVEAAAEDLTEARGKGIVIAGSYQSPAVHALANQINQALSNIGATVDFINPVEASPVNHTASLKQLVDDMNAGSVDMVIVAGDVNPVYSAPADFGFAEAYANVGTRVRLSRYKDETSKLSHWAIPQLHTAETWGDARGYDGTVSLIQPQIAPLYDGKCVLELLSALVDETEVSAHDSLQAYWKRQKGEADFDRFWRQSLSLGVVADSAYKPVTVRAGSGSAGAFVKPNALENGELEVVFIDDPSIGDGVFSNNAWLQEVPNPLTKLTWDNAVIVGYSTSQEMGLSDEDLVEVTVEGRSVKGPVLVQPGHPSNAITLHLGYGRTAVGKVGVATEKYLGFDAYSLRTSDHTYGSKRATIKKLNASYKLARTEEHYNMEGRGLVRHVDEETFANEPGIVLHGENHEFHNPTDTETLMDLEEKKWEGGHRSNWGMTIDLNQCTGCNACVVACQSENLIPVVGKDEVRRGREMHWIRIDRYYYAGREKKIPTLNRETERRTPALNTLSEEARNAVLDNPTVYFQPVPCMQCENALCEIVCPVGATQHSREGLNDMVYNRCIGTRYCSNNCPYKVRRFNFFNYGRTPLGSRGDRGHSDQGVSMKFDAGHVHPESLKPMRNPDVTLRTRGVMEKCTYCVQRINASRIEAKKVVNEDGTMGAMITDDSEFQVVTACQQSCPTGAIEFGNILEKDSRVAKKKASARNYAILADTNTRPRTTYLAKITNPNRKLNG
jgi:molybdopterin-containing oxidoreductase family iron-sulfur binding subunit